VEFTVEPFREGEMGQHVTAALDALRAAGLEPDVGPFGTTVQGEVGEVFDAVGAAAAAAFSSDATGLALTARAVRTRTAGADDFLAALGPAAGALGARVVEPEDMSAGDVPLVWRGEVVGGLRGRRPPGDRREGLGELVELVEGEFGAPLADLPRADKQRAVRLLDERGAFAFRNAADEVADAMGVSRVTIYNYLNATRAGGGR